YSVGIILKCAAKRGGDTMKPVPFDAIDPSTYDVVIAGGGAGGLLIALALTAEGKKSLIIEKADRLGGVWFGYHIDGYRIDNGLHVITRVKRGAFARFMRNYLSPPPEFVLHEGWYFRVHDKVGTIPTSVGETLRWPLTNMRGRLGLAKIGAKIKTMKLEEMKTYKDISFLDFMESRKATNQVVLDVMQSAIYMAAGVGIDQASAYEALRTLKDTDKESGKLEQIKKLLLGTGDGSYDEGYVIGGMKGLVESVIEAIDGDYLLNAPVERIHESDDHVTGLTVAGRRIEHPLIISNIPLWDLSKTIDSASSETTTFFERWSSLRPTRGITLWLGLDRVVIGDRKNRVLVHPNPNRWIVSISSFDPSSAPAGKELVALAMMAIPGKNIEEQVAIMKSHGFEKYFPEVLEHIEMEHVQMSYATRAALIPGQTDLDRPGPKTPIEGFYIVGTDTAGSGVGLQQAANSAEGALAAMKYDGVI
ncbi:MAG: NAD(P)/FAD-dependent oxidoreductase, partial [Candidatus Thorarchaeota archaeon]|nr:NAD(P)/FAD-dependent oxidoreductase [Candidatus Thorarchaeota archaeon]